MIWTLGRILQPYPGALKNTPFVTCFSYFCRFTADIGKRDDFKTFRHLLISRSVRQENLCVLNNAGESMTRSKVWLPVVNKQESDSTCINPPPAHNNSCCSNEPKSKCSVTETALSLLLLPPHLPCILPNTSDLMALNSPSDVRLKSSLAFWSIWNNNTISLIKCG